ncbi:hypothetical protein [Paracoccus saliphilus]|uniref:Uncharacterized protein n=1 Tax=Paracoccus saliphilus TaxID=405559 RepID=A0AA46A5G2_9RHOB|nr:hypothetical protein [Paracoccus saliphilus]WCR04239.1 hypothetical protein JHX88_05750 [Paracoccus saliphilus]SIS80632.1 hypothetical protein SAMN05421772_105137 [Paracoccus saliphilus]
MALNTHDAMMTDRNTEMIIGLALSVAWLLLLLLFWLLIPGETHPESGGMTRILTITGVVMPFALIWMAVGIARAINKLREEAAELRGNLSQLQELAAKRPKPASAEPIVTGAQPLRQPAAKAPARAAKPVPPAARPAHPASQPQQASLRFDAPEPVEIPSEILIRALNFPDDANDQETIAALRMALKDHETARVLRAAQDVVTLLAEHDVYMDELPPDPVPPAIWRRFAEGERDEIAAKIGGIHDEIALETATALLRGDEIFRDTAHHFLRHFDVLLTRDTPRLDDEQLAALADTRSARGFMLIGRAAGVFG